MLSPTFVRLRIAAVFSAVALLAPPGIFATGTADFPPLQAWQAAVASGDTVGLQMLYSSNPAAQVETAHGTLTATEEVSFWTGLKARTVNLDVQQASSPQPGLQQVVFEAEVVERLASKPVFVSEAQLWMQQGGSWRIVQAKRTDVAHLQQPMTVSKDIYPAGVDARAEIREAVQRAKKHNKRVLLVFGANWCYDCHVLDLAFQRRDLAPVLAANYEVVHVDVGEGDRNQDLMQEYQVPMAKGIPALAVLDENGKLLYGQQHGEFQRARALTPEQLVAFLRKWKAPQS
jgi:thiol-disulfide isomerase/thioredoxin